MCNSKYNYEAVLEPVGQACIGKPFKNQDEMWRVLYEKYGIQAIQTVLQDYFQGISKTTIRLKAKHAGAKMRGPGGRHETEAFLHRPNIVRRGAYFNNKITVKSGRRCVRCGGDTGPNYWYCPACHSIVSSGKVDIDCYGHVNVM